MKFLAIAALLLISTGNAIACGQGAQRMTPLDASKLQVFATLDPITVSKPFGLQIFLCDETGAQVIGAGLNVEVEGWMPRHKHGMNYRASVTATAPGTYSISNMVFHMPGLWQVRVNLASDETAKPETHLLDVEVK